MNFLHSFEPNPILISFGFIKIHWYGLFVVLGILACIGVAIKLAGYYKIKKDKVIDLAFYLIILGIIGARIYHVFLELPCYLQYPLDIFKVWQGGLAIHGGIIAGVIFLYFYARKYKINLWLYAAITVPGLALAQAIGRWGNYFNQELFGLPTSLPWGIPINLMNRPLEYISAEYFHPTFIYESIGNLIIFAILIALHIYIIKKKIFKTYSYKLIAMSYLILYSILRLSTEFIRIDRTPELLGLRLPQVVSIIIIIVSIIILLLPKLKKRDTLN